MNLDEREKYENWFRATYGKAPMPRTSPAHDFCWAGYKAGAASRDAEIAELVAALERMRVAGGSQEFHIAWELAKDVLDKVRKP